MIDMKSKDLDKLCEDFEEMKFKAEAWWPTVEEIRTLIEPNLKEMLPFALWITETADTPQTDADKEAQKYLLRLIYNEVNIIYEEDE